MDILIESTKEFEIDLGKLTKEGKTLTVQKINDCASLFLTQKAEVYRRFNCPSLLCGLNGYESSLYTLQVSERLWLILAVDEDPLFDQVIFTLFRVIKHGDLAYAYQDVRELLYQDILSHDRNRTQISSIPA
jgi:hypothetical protein